MDDAPVMAVLDGLQEDAHKVPRLLLVVDDLRHDAVEQLPPFYYAQGHAQRNAQGIICTRVFKVRLVQGYTSLYKGVHGRSLAQEITCQMGSRIPKYIGIRYRVLSVLQCSFIFSVDVLPCVMMTMTTKLDDDGDDAMLMDIYTMENYDGGRVLRYELSYSFIAL